MGAICCRLAMNKFLRHTLLLQQLAGTLHIWHHGTTLLLAGHKIKPLPCNRICLLLYKVVNLRVKPQGRRKQAYAAEDLRIFQGAIETDEGPQRTSGKSRMLLR